MNICNIKDCLCERVRFFILNCWFLFSMCQNNWRKFVFCLLITQSTAIQPSMGKVMEVIVRPSDTK